MLYESKFHVEPAHSVVSWVWVCVSSPEKKAMRKKIARGQMREEHECKRWNMDGLNIKGVFIDKERGRCRETVNYMSRTK